MPPHRRILRRLKQIVETARPGAAHGTRADGWEITAWRAWHPCSGRWALAFRVDTRNIDEAERLARAFYGPAVAATAVRHDILGATYALPLGPAADDVDVPPRPGVIRWHSERFLARTFGEPTGRLSIGRYTLEPAD